LITPAPWNLRSFYGVKFHSTLPIARLKIEYEREIDVVANKLIRHAVAKPVAPSLRIKVSQMAAIFASVHLVACSLLVGRLCIPSAGCAI
jgi:hypothetical protein